MNNKKQLQAKLGGGLFIDLAMIAAGGLLLPVAAFPNTPQPADIPQLTLNKAVELALQNNSDLKMTRQTVRSAETTVLQKKASYYPKLDVATYAQRIIEMRDGVVRRDEIISNHHKAESDLSNHDCLPNVERQRSRDEHE